MASETAIVEGNLQHFVKRPGSVDVPALRQSAPDDLVALAQLYDAVYLQGSPETTVRSRRKHLEYFLRFYFELYNHLNPAEWYPSVTREWLRRQTRDRGVEPGTISTWYGSVRHFARWAHSALDPSPFPLGSPTDGVKPPQEPDYKFAGLSRKNVLRLSAAAETLAGRPSPRGTSVGYRDQALLHTALGTGLRISELLSLEPKDFDRKKRGFRNIIQKGGSRRGFVKLWYPEDHLAPLKAWLEERGDSPGPLFSTRTGRALGRDQAWRILKRIEAQANAHLKEDDRFSVTPHALRHTLMRRITEDPKYGIHVAMAASGHRSDKYIWTYTKPSDDELENLD